MGSLFILNEQDGMPGGMPDILPVRSTTRRRYTGSESSGRAPLLGGMLTRTRLIRQGHLWRARQVERRLRLAVIKLGAGSTASSSIRQRQTTP